jgi:uncharacterized protein
VDVLELLRLNLFSPMVLAFLLGLVAVWVKSDLSFPKEFSSVVGIYLLFAIGFKGGAALSSIPVSSLVLPILATLALGVGKAALAFLILKSKFDRSNAAAIAAHYGSVSAVTFTAALTFASAQYSNLEGYLPALMAILEVPGIAVALAFAQKGDKHLWHELFTGRSLLMVLGGLTIGLLSGQSGLERVKPFFIDPFMGILTLFLLEMGLVAGQRLRDLRGVGVFLVGFAVLMPMLNGAAGVLLARAIGLSEGGAFVFAVMSASASYIAAPAAVRVALPEANPAYYLGAALGMTFPFNLTLGIPLYALLAGLLY